MYKSLIAEAFVASKSITYHKSQAKAKQAKFQVDMFIPLETFSQSMQGTQNNITTGTFDSFWQFMFVTFCIARICLLFNLAKGFLLSFS